MESLTDRRAEPRVHKLRLDAQSRKMGWGRVEPPVGHHFRDVLGVVTLVIVSSGVMPRLELHDLCAGLSAPVIEPPAPTASMWSAVNAIGCFQSRSKSKGWPHRWQGAPVLRACRLSASRLATYARSLRMVPMCASLLGSGHLTRGSHD